MSLVELTVEELRCLRRAALDLAPGLNLVTGPNGAGKTSLLEAVFLLGRGRSFRTRNTERLIRLGETTLRVVGRTAGPVAHTIGVEVSKEEGVRAKLDGAFVASLASLSEAFAVQVIDPEIHKLIEEGPNRRRRWLDWLVFHVEPGFVDQWTRYARTLRQRNAALKAPSTQIEVWDPELIATGERISHARRRALEQLRPHWEEAIGELLGMDLTLTYHQGWSQELSLPDALQRSLARDRERLTSTCGPHRADVAIRINGRAARDVLSRGQQKLAAVSLVLSQIELLQSEYDVLPTLLLDDPAAELDTVRLSAFIQRVRRLRGQLVVTAIQSNFSLLGMPEKVFHVEQGGVAQL